MSKPNIYPTEEICLLGLFYLNEAIDDDKISNVKEPSTITPFARDGFYVAEWCVIFE